MARLLLLGLLLLAPAAWAGDAQLDVEAARRAHRMAADVMSPYCPGRTLADCPSADAGALRQELRGWIDAGVPDLEVRGRLEQRFGDGVSGVPRSLFGWLLPGLMLGAGALALVFGLRRLAAPRAAVPDDWTPDPAAEAAPDAELEREPPTL